MQTRIQTAMQGLTASLMPVHLKEPVTHTNIDTIANTHANVN